MACNYNKSMDCPCTYDCPRHGRCCACVAHHAPNQFPACFFSQKAEAEYDRSFKRLVKDHEG